ncbi:MAG: glycoside hydrolase family 2 TIM barrel-domain containing protein [Christensenellales bacterium]|jgi:beta-galactosidase
MTNSNTCRKEKFFGFDWFFRLDGECAPGDRKFAGFRPVQLPHDWSVEYPFTRDAPSSGSGGYARTGVGWYKKLFVPEDPEEGRLLLRFDGAYMNTTVWLNGRNLGNHIYGYTPFSFDITRYVKPGKENLLTVRVDNSAQPNSRWYTGSGITRNVWLRRTGSPYIPEYGVFITTPDVSKERAVLKAQVDFENPARAEGIAVLTVTSSDGIVLKETLALPKERKGRLVFQSVIQQPFLWSADNPVLYTAKVRLMTGEAASDEETIRFGVRSLEFDPIKGLLVNGVHTKLRGFCAHHDGGCVGAAVPPEIWRRRLETMKAMGANSLRCAHNPPDPAVLDLCDELGIYVMDEAFDEWRILKSKAAGSNSDESRGYSQYFQRCGRADCATMVLRDRNHPSVIIWSIGNEVPDQTAEDGPDTAKMLMRICRKLDGTRPCTQANDQLAAEPHAASLAFLETLDLVGYNYTTRWRERAETMYDADKISHPDWLQIGTENLGLGGHRCKPILEMERQNAYWAAPYWSMPVRVGKLLQFTETRDWVIGDYMWTGIDYLGESRWPVRVGSAGVIDICGFPKEGYYFYQAAWTKEPMAYLVPHWNITSEREKWIPVLCFTNCQEAELFLNGRSLGRKASCFPEFGMTERYMHYDRPVPYATTNDMFLRWDVPYAPGKLEVVAYNDGLEACRYTMHTAEKPVQLTAEVYGDAIPADRRSVAQIAFTVLDSRGHFVPTADGLRINFTVKGPAEILGVDSSDPCNAEPLRTDTCLTYAGKAFMVLRSTGKPGRVTVTASVEGLKGCKTVFHTVKV